jgi:DNA-binding CsgD family transcriptional regulator
MAVQAGSQLLDREVELAALADMLDDARAGSGRLVLLSGEAGIGKSALVRACCADAGRSVRVMTGVCDPLVTPRPLGPFVEIATTVGGRVHEIVAGDGVAFQVAEALADVLAGSAPTILVVEDVHWADEATLDVLRLLGRRLAELPVLVVVTYRGVERTRRHPLTTLLGELAGNAAVERLQLTPLSADAVARLADRSRHDPVELHRITGGNPFFVTEALASGSDGIPATVRDAVLARAARLSASAQTVLEVVALSPAETELELIERHGSLRDVDACVEHGLLVEQGRGFAFRHELARQAFEETLPPGRAAELHRSILATLTELGGADLTRLAHHASGANDPRGVLRHAPAAAEQAAKLGAHREAADHYRLALQFADALDDRNRARLHLRHSVERYLIGDDEAGIASIDAAVAGFRALGDEAALAATLRWRALALLNWGYGDGAAAAAAEALRLLEQQPPGYELAMTYSLLASLAILDERLDDGEAWARRGLELANEIDSVEAQASCLGALGLAAAHRGTSESGAFWQRSLDLARTSSLENTIGRTYLFMSMAATRERSLERLRSAVDDGLAYAAERGLTVWEDVLLACRSWHELEEGRWEAASWTVGQVLARNCILSSTQARLVLGVLRARRGDPGAAAVLAEAAPVVERTGVLWWRYQLAAAQAETAWLEGRRDAIEGATDAAFRAALDRRASWPAAELGYWRIRAGLEQHLPDWARGPFALQARGDWRGAAAEWARAGCRYETAIALAEGDEPAQKRALQELQALGAGPATRILTRRLREGGVRSIRSGPRTATRANPAGLTPREVDVLKLIADGLRNAEIAARLYLSSRTVDHHVSTILRKLGTKTRGEAVARARRENLIRLD